MTAIAMLVAAPVAADDGGKDKPKYGPVEEKAVLAGTAKLDPRLGYVLLQNSIRITGMFLRVPDDATRADYQADLDKAMTKARKRYAEQMANWEAQARTARAQKVDPPAKPQEPTVQSLSVEAIDLRDLAAFGPNYVFNKAPGKFTYLTAVKPGTFIYYGPVFYGPDGGAFGTCFCMGTVRFEVKPGQITDLGNALWALPQPTLPYDAQTQNMRAWAERRAEGKDKPVNYPAPLTPPEPAFGLPDSLKDWPSARAELTAHGKLNNFYGVFVSRMFPIPGVLDYRRDHVIDARTGTEVTSATIYTQAKIKR